MSIENSNQRSLGNSLITTNSMHITKSNGQILKPINQLIDNFFQVPLTGTNSSLQDRVIKSLTTASKFKEELIAESTIEVSRQQRTHGEYFANQMRNMNLGVDVLDNGYDSGYDSCQEDGGIYEN